MFSRMTALTLSKKTSFTVLVVLILLCSGGIVVSNSAPIHNIDSNSNISPNAIDNAIDSVVDRNQQVLNTIQTTGRMSLKTKKTKYLQHQQQQKEHKDTKTILLSSTNISYHNYDIVRQKQQQQQQKQTRFLQSNDNTQLFRPIVIIIFSFLGICGSIYSCIQYCNKQRKQKEEKQAKEKEEERVKQQQQQLVKHEVIRGPLVPTSSHSKLTKDESSNHNRDNIGINGKQSSISGNRVSMTNTPVEPIRNIHRDDLTDDCISTTPLQNGASNVEKYSRKEQDDDSDEDDEHDDEYDADEYENNNSKRTFLNLPVVQGSIVTPSVQTDPYSLTSTTQRRTKKKPNTNPNNNNHKNNNNNIASVPVVDGSVVADSVYTDRYSLTSTHYYNSAPGNNIPNNNTGDFNSTTNNNRNTNDNNIPVVDGSVVADSVNTDLYSVASTQYYYNNNNNNKSNKYKNVPIMDASVVADSVVTDPYSLTSRNKNNTTTTTSTSTNGGSNTLYNNRNKTYYNYNDTAYDISEF